MEDLQSEASSICNSQIRKFNLNGDLFKIGCVEGLFELSNYNEINNQTLDFEQLELKFPFIYEENQNNIFEIIPEAEESMMKDDEEVKIHFKIENSSGKSIISKESSNKTTETNKTNESQEIKSKLCKNYLFNEVNRNIFEKINKLINTYSMIYKIPSLLGILYKNKDESYITDEIIKNFKENINKNGSLFDTIIFILHTFFLYVNDQKEDSIKTNKTTEKNNSYLLFLSIFDSTLTSSLQSKYKDDSYTKANNYLSNSVSTFSNNSTNYTKTNKTTKANGIDSPHNRKANMRKRGKTFFNQVLIRLINCLLFFLIPDFHGKSFIKSMNFNDPHLKNNKNNMNKHIIDLIKEEFQSNPSECSLLSVLDLLIKNKIKFKNWPSFKKVVSQVIISILYRSYKEGYKDFYMSLLYNLILYENISNSHGEKYICEFDCIVKEFLEFSEKEYKYSRKDG